MSEVERIEIEYGDTPIEAATKLIQSQCKGIFTNRDFFDEYDLEEIADHLLAYTKGFKKACGGDTDA